MPHHVEDEARRELEVGLNRKHRCRIASERPLRRLVLFWIVLPGQRWQSHRNRFFTERLKEGDEVSLVLFC